MKGIDTMLLLILIVVIIAALSASLISNVRAGWNYESTKEAAQEKMAKTGETTYTVPIIKDPFEVKDLLHILPISGPFQPSEIACYIGDVIYNDYSKNGKETTRKKPDGKCWKRTLLNKQEECLIDDPDSKNLMSFTLGRGVYVANWETVLSTRPQGECHLCAVGGNAIPLLDETCVNMQLRDRKVQGSEVFCSAPFFPTNVKGEEATSVKFGNQICSKNNYNDNTVSDWSDNCDAFCGNGENLIYDWRNVEVSDCASGNSNYCPTANDPPETVQDRHRTITQNEYGVLDDDGRNYLFGVTWSENTKNYNVYFARIPKPTFEGSAIDRIGNLVERSKEIVRFNNLGYFSNLARRTAAFLFYGDGTTMPQIIQRIGEKAGLKYSAEEEGCRVTNELQKEVASEGCVYFSSCTNEASCFETPPITLSSKDSGGTTFNEIIDDFLGTDYKKGKTIVVKSTLDENGALEPGKLYGIVVNNWFDAVSLSASDYAYSYYLRTVGIMELSKKNCCGSPEPDNTISLSLNSNDVETGTTVGLIADNLYYCDGKTIYFYNSDCTGKKPSEMGAPVATCPINNPETLNCLISQPFTPSPTGCNGVITAPSSSQDYWACIKKDGTDTAFDPTKGEVSAKATLNVKAPAKFQWRCSTWNYVSDGSDNTALFTSPGCDESYLNAVSCLTENRYPLQYPNFDGKYNEDDIQSILIDGNKCKIGTRDVEGSNEQNRSVCVLCTDRQTKIEWGLTWTDGLDAVSSDGWYYTLWTADADHITATSKECSWGHPVSCLINATYEGYKNLLTGLYLESNEETDGKTRCKATIRSPNGVFAFTLGIVCSETGYGDVQWSGFSGGVETKDMAGPDCRLLGMGCLGDWMDNEVATFDTLNCPAGSPISWHTKVDTSNMGSYGEDIVQSIWGASGQHLTVSADDVGGTALWIFGTCYICVSGQCVGSDCSEHSRSVGVMCKPGSVDPMPQCANGKDDDNDGKIDYPDDSDCTSYGGTSESGGSPCFARGTACTSNSQCCSNECGSWSGACYDSSLSGGGGASCYEGSECSSNSCMGPVVPGHPGYCIDDGSGGCLIEGSKIQTPNGFKNIENIQAGDTVIGYKDGKIVEEKVTRKMVHFGFWNIYYYKDYWFTETHKVYPSLDGEATIVSLLSDIKKQYTGKVYDIETETHNYFGENSLLIHNFFMK